MTVSYQAQIGRRLRSVREQRGLSLQAVEFRSRGRWKAMTLGSWERGDRAMSAVHLAEVADFYGIAPADLMPAGAEPAGVPLRLDIGPVSPERVQAAIELLGPLTAQLATQLHRAYAGASVLGSVDVDMGSPSAEPSSNEEEQP